MDIAHPARPPLPEHVVVSYGDTGYRYFLEFHIHPDVFRNDTPANRQVKAYTIAITLVTILFHKDFMPMPDEEVLVW